MSMNTVPRIFLSYSQADSHKIPLITKELPSIVEGLAQYQSHDEKEIIPVFSANEISPGENIRQQLLQSMQKASAVVVVWTAESARSSHVNYEIGIAEALGKPTVVVVPDKSAPELPSSLQGYQVVKLEDAS